MSQFSQFYRQHSAGLFAYLLRMTGEYHLACDLLQEAFTRFLQRYGSDIASKPLLYKIARNLFFDHLRKAKQGEKSDVSPLEPVHNAEQQLLMRENFNRVLEAIKQLNSNDREILSVVAGGDLSYREIASVLGISEANVKIRIHRARVRLKGIFEKENQGEPWTL